MAIIVLKKNGTSEHYTDDKVIRAVSKAMAKVGELEKDTIDGITHQVYEDVAYLAKNSNTTQVHVDDIHNIVERVLMDTKNFSAAKEYITYRARHVRSLVSPRAAYKPFEYPHLAKYVEAIQHSYWIHTEFDYSSDKQDFLAILTPGQRQSIERCMLAISQVEVKVKDFWLLIGRWFPKPEIQEVGAVFAESECYAPGTGVLTSKGVKLIENISEDDEVAQYNIKTKKIEYVHPVHVIHKPYAGKMLRFYEWFEEADMSVIDQTVTENHEMIVHNRSENRNVKMKARILAEKLRNGEDLAYLGIMTSNGVDHFQSLSPAYPIPEEFEYEGYVHCVTMPLGNVIVSRCQAEDFDYVIQGNCRHARTYAFLLELLGLNEKFIELLEVPVFKKRFEYLSRSVRGAKSDVLGDYVEALVLFTLFVENVSLFSQFLIMSTYNKEMNILSGMSNGIAATSLEEVLHRDFGIELINTLRNEQPELFTDDLKASVIKMSRTAFEAECELVDWIFESGENEFLTKSDIKNYIKNRLNEGLDKSGFGVLFDDVDYGALEKTDWFDVQTSSTMKTDFFKKRSNTYTKRAEAFSEDSIF